MIVLGFDTATAETAVGALRDGELLFESEVGPGQTARPRHASALLVELERAAAAAGGWDAVDRLAVGIGPGTFTGLRIGIASARALAQARDLPLAAVGTLDALARGAGEIAGARPVLATVDARRGEVFAALFGVAGGQLWEPFVIAPGELATRIPEAPDAPLAVGDGALRFRRELEDGGAHVPPRDDPVHRIAGRHVCALGARTVPSDPGGIVPLYLRAPDAERWRQRGPR